MSAVDKIAQYAHLLGRVSDGDIAEKAGVSRTAVANLRRQRGIAAFKKTRAAAPPLTAENGGEEAQGQSFEENRYVRPSVSGAMVNPPETRSPDATAEAQRLTGASVAIVSDRTADRRTLLKTVLAQSGFWPILAQTTQTLGVEPGDLRLLITPDLAVLDKQSPTGTDPRLVEDLIDLLHERGYGQVAVGAAPSHSDQWLDNRDVVVVADLVGYRFVTDAGHVYDIVDLSEDLVPVPFPVGSALHGTQLARAWVEADFRINIAKNKTHEEFFYALGLHNLIGVLPLRDKHYHYRVRLKPWDVCLDVLQQTPPQFTLIDAIASNHGSAGSRVPHPLETHTLIAGQDTLLTDWVGAVKMNLDPYSSPINAKALTVIGLPEPHTIAGDLTPYDDWENVHPLWADLTRRINESADLSPWMQLASLPVNRDLFPFKGELGDRLNALLSPVFSKVDHNPAAYWAALGLQYGGAATAQSLDVWRTLFFKQQLHWRDVPLDLDLSSLELADYEAVIGYIEPLEDLIQQTPPDKNGLRWRYLDGSVLFKFARVIEAPFEAFVQRVDISRSIQFMKDYIGGCDVAIARDARGRVTHQAERNIYLPQPNYLVLYGGKVIDVAKLEYIRYETESQKIFWRTVKSSNQSAEFDDGSVTFTKIGEHQTLVTIVARQKFTLPLFWQAVNLDLNPPVKNFLVSDAYYTYFNDTLNNFEAQYEGREFRIGQPWNAQKGELGATPSDNALPELAAKTIETVDQLAQRLTSGHLLPRVLTKQAPRATVDADGFSHFTPSPPHNAASTAKTGQQAMQMMKSFGAIAGEFLTDLSKAVRKDLGLGPDE